MGGGGGSGQPGDAIKAVVSSGPIIAAMSPQKIQLFERNVYKKEFSLCTDMEDDWSKYQHLSSAERAMAKVHHVDAVMMDPQHLYILSVVTRPATWLLVHHINPIAAESVRPQLVAHLR